MTVTEILAALVAGKFKPFEAEDRRAFCDAGDDALMWHPTPDVAVIVCTSEGELIVEVYDWAGSGRQGSLRLAKLGC